MALNLLLNWHLEQRQLATSYSGSGMRAHGAELIAREWEVQLTVMATMRGVIDLGCLVGPRGLLRVATGGLVVVIHAGCLDVATT